jgi:hypothetical protein
MNQEQLIFQLTTFFIDFEKPLHTPCLKNLISQCVGSNSSHDFRHMAQPKVEKL